MSAAQLRLMFPATSTPSLSWRLAQVAAARREEALLALCNAAAKR